MIAECAPRPVDIRHLRVRSALEPPWPLVCLALVVMLVAAADAQAATLAGAAVRVVDGDTIHVQRGAAVEKVRYIGIDTPETHHPTKGEEPGGRQATEANRGLVEGRRVRLELDVQVGDRYGRLLGMSGWGRRW